MVRVGRDLEDHLVPTLCSRSLVVSDKDHGIADSARGKKVTSCGEFTLFHMFSWNGRQRLPSL